MKKSLTFSLLMLLLLTAPHLCFALMLIEPVSKERARQLGMELRLKGGGTNEVWVEFEFKTEGELKDFWHVSMEIREGDKVLVGHAPLKGQPSDSGRVHVGFMANRAFLEKVTLRVVTGHSKDMKGHDVRLKDFVELERVR